MLITYDCEADIIYIELHKVVADDSKDIEEGVTVLLDSDGHLVSLELLDAPERLGKEQLHSVTLQDLAFDLSLSRG